MTLAETYEQILTQVRGQLTGDPQTDLTRLQSLADTYRDHPLSQEILRELGRMWYQMLPPDTRVEADRLTAREMDDLSIGLDAARAKMHARDFEGARGLLDALIHRHGSTPGSYLDDSVSEYRRFANEFEHVLYLRMYQPGREVRGIPYDRGLLYFLYGFVLLELSDTSGAETALLEALRVNPIRTQVIFELGEVFKLERRWQDFRKVTAHALAVAYTDQALARAYRNFGFAAIEDGDYDLAVACYFMSIGMDRESSITAQSELFHIQSKSGRMVVPPAPAVVEQTLAANGIQIGPSNVVLSLLEEFNAPAN